MSPVFFLALLLAKLYLGCCSSSFCRRLLFHTLRVAFPMLQTYNQTRDCWALRRKEGYDISVNTTEVVAALIWENDTFLICQRPAHKARGLLWEFVGGKVEPGETKQQALTRECREELGVDLIVQNEFMDVTHAYPDLLVHLTVFHARIGGGAIQKLEHNDIRYISVSETAQYRFCPADRAIVERLGGVWND